MLKQFDDLLVKVCVVQSQKHGHMLCVFQLQHPFPFFMQILIVAAVVDFLIALANGESGVRYVSSVCVYRYCCCADVVHQRCQVQASVSLGTSPIMEMHAAMSQRAGHMSMSSGNSKIQYSASKTPNCCLQCISGACCHYLNLDCKWYALLYSMACNEPTNASKTATSK